MEAVNVQALPITGRKSPRLPAMTLLALHGDVGQSSSSCCDFQTIKEDRNGCLLRNDLSATAGSGRQLQQHRVDVGRLCLTRFEQRAEQLLQQDQGLQVDQVLDLLGLLLKRQHSNTDKETSIPHQQQASTSSCTSSGGEAQMQPPNRVASTPDPRPWMNSDNFTPQKQPGLSTGGTSASEVAAEVRELCRNNRGSNNTLLLPLHDAQHGQPQHSMTKTHLPASATGTVAPGEIKRSESDFTRARSNSDNKSFMNHRREHDQQQLPRARQTECSANSIQQPFHGMVVATYDETGPESGRSSNNCGVQQPNFETATPSRLPLRGDAPAADQSVSTAEVDTRLREAGQQQRQQLQQPSLRHQALPQPPVRQQHRQLEQSHTQQSLMKQSPNLHPLPLQSAGQWQHLDMPEQQHQQTVEQLQRGGIDENVLNEETRHLLSKSLDVLMGDVHMHTLKDMLLRKVPKGESASRPNSECSAETSYADTTHIALGEPTSLDAAVLSLLEQQQPHQQRQGQHIQLEPKADRELLSRTCSHEPPEEQHTPEGNEQRAEEERTISRISCSMDSPGNPAPTDTECRGEGVGEDIRVTAANHRQRKGQQCQLQQKEQPVQERAKRTGLRTGTVPEKESPCYSTDTLTKSVKCESVHKRIVNAETLTAAGTAGNKRTSAAQRQQMQQAERRRGRSRQQSTPGNLLPDEERPTCANSNGSESVNASDGCAALCSDATAEREEHEAYGEIRKPQPRTAAAGTVSHFESSPTDNSPLTTRWRSAALRKTNASTTVDGVARATPASRDLLGHARSGRTLCENEQRVVAAGTGSEEQLAAACAVTGLQAQRNEQLVGFISSAAAGDGVAADSINSGAANNCGAAGVSCDTEKHLAATAAKRAQLYESDKALTGTAATEETKTACVTLPSYCSRRRRIQEPCELALAAARLEQQGHTFTPPFYLRAPAALASSSNGSVRCSVFRENCTRRDTGGGAEEMTFRNADFATERTIGDATRKAAGEELQAKSRAAPDSSTWHAEDTTEDEEELEAEILTQQQLALLKHIYSVLSQAEEYFSFKSALYQLHIKRQLKKCVSSLAAAAAAANSDKEGCVHTAASGASKNRSPTHASGSVQSKAIRLFSTMPPIPINAVEQRALLSVRKHLQAGGSGALLCQGDGMAELLMEELDELLTSLVNKLLLIIVVKFQTCFIHAPARAQLREFLVSFVFPGDMATQLLFRDHVQAVVHARIRHFRDSVGRTLRHQPPPSPPLTAALMPRNGIKRSQRAAAGMSSPVSRATEEEGGENEDRQKKQKIHETAVEVPRRDTRRRTGAAVSAGRIHSYADRRKAAAIGLDTGTYNHANPNHSAARDVAPSSDAGLGRQSSSNERKASPTSRSRQDREALGNHLPSTTSDVQNTAGIAGASAPREGHRLSRASEHGNAAAASKTATGGALAAAQRKGTNAGTGGIPPASGSENALSCRSRAGVYSRRKRGAAATSDGTETRSPSVCSSQSGSAAAARSCVSSPSTDSSSSGVVSQTHQRSGREPTNYVRRGVVTTIAAGKPELKAINGAPASVGLIVSGDAAEVEPQKDDRCSPCHALKSARRGDKGHKGGPSGEGSSEATSPERAQQTLFSPVSRYPLRSTILQEQQQLVQQRQVDQERCDSGTQADIVGRWVSTAASSGEREESCCEGGQPAVPAVAKGVRARSGSKTSLLSRGSTRESAYDSSGWDHGEGPRSKNCPAQAPLQEAQQCTVPSPVPSADDKRVTSPKGSADCDNFITAAKKAAGDTENVSKDLAWTALGRDEEDETTQALAAAIGGALDPTNDDSAMGAAGDAWDWLSVAAASKDEQQEKLRLTLESLLNAWTTSGDECRSERGTQGSDDPSSNSQYVLGGFNGSTGNADGWFNFTVGDFACDTEKYDRSEQPEELSLDHFEPADKVLHFSSAGVSSKDASLPSPSSVKGPPSEASTSFPPHEERTPPAERSAAEDAVATRSLAVTENSTSSRRTNPMCLPDESLRTERAAAEVTAAGRSAADTEERGEIGNIRSLRIPLPRDLNSAEEAEYDGETAVLNGLSHTAIADYLLTYCKENATAYEIAAQLKHRQTGEPGAYDRATNAVNTPQGCGHGDLYEESRLRDEKLICALQRAEADTMKNCAAVDIELPELNAEVVAPSHGGDNSLAISLSTLLTGPSPLLS